MTVNGAGVRHTDRRDSPRFRRMMDEIATRAPHLAVVRGMFAAFCPCATHLPPPRVYLSADRVPVNDAVLVKRAFGDTTSVFYVHEVDAADFTTGGIHFSEVHTTGMLEPMPVLSVDQFAFMESNARHDGCRYPVTPTGGDHRSWCVWQHSPLRMDSGAPVKPLEVRRAYRFGAQTLESRLSDFLYVVPRPAQHIDVDAFIIDRRTGQARLVIEESVAVKPNGVPHQHRGIAAATGAHAMWMRTPPGEECLVSDTGTVQVAATSTAPTAVLNDGHLTVLRQALGVDITDMEDTVCAPDAAYRCQTVFLSFVYGGEVRLKRYRGDVDDKIGEFIGTVDL